MSQATVELKIPTEIYERAQRIASQSDRSIETVLLDGLTVLFGVLPDTGVSPDELANYTDEQLWAVVYQRLAWLQDARLQELVALGKQERLSSNEQTEMEHLIKLVDHQMLLRSEALLLLKNRGHDVDAMFKTGT